ncbi:cyclic nucleotide-binding domain-containing protein [Legionella waltersii]|uniref:CAAX amino terminal protease family protein n=1 Tax=Legionella waltersii TaxID=66969 RepID=A0A0W1ALP5_9GAMM|nr:cyclic nucleotide-binding domain-containing protein [Legionella waltersii]KTD82206.1 CAAX amino terminal protease family protein [Legionella waltersii]SNV10715.1 CAAX amino terminal protease family protein [Legionella waltersii]
MNNNDTLKKMCDGFDQSDDEIIGNYQSIKVDLSKSDLDDFLKIGQSETYPAGTIIFNEGDPADSFFIIIEGVAEIYKKAVDEYGEQSIHVLASLSKDAIVGEMALIENANRSAYVRAKTDLTVIKYKLESIGAKPKLNVLLIKNIAHILSERLRFTTDITVKNMQIVLKESLGRNALGVFIIALLWIICLYTLSLHYLVWIIHKEKITTTLSVCLISIYAIATLIAMHFTGLPYSRFGITLNNWAKNTLEAVALTIPPMLIVLLIKVFIVEFNPLEKTQLFTGTKLFYVNQQVDWEYYLTTLFLYSLFAPIQELIARCALQSTFFNFLPGKQSFRKWNAIILSNLLFSTMHTHFGVRFTFLTFIAGLYWGWLYHRQRSFLGVSVSHALLGSWALLVVGLR